MRKKRMPGPRRIEVHEPGFEDCAGHVLKRMVHAMVQLDLVIKRPQRSCYFVLYAAGWQRDSHCFGKTRVLETCYTRVLDLMFPHCVTGIQALQIPVDVTWGGLLRVDTQKPAEARASGWRVQ